MLTRPQALAIRMRSLLLHPSPGGAPPADDVPGVAEWFGAMQAQQHASVLWSLGRRLPGSTAASVEAALERREVVRTWPMRGTLHLVPARDAAWMLQLTASRQLAGARASRERLGITAEVAARAVDVLAGALVGGRGLTRSQCSDLLGRAGTDPEGQRAYHLLAYAAQVGVICMGPNRGPEQTFWLLEEVAPDARRPERDEALATLALRYVRSHGPVTRHDLARWTGLPMSDVKRAIAGAGQHLTPATVDDTEVHLAAGALDAGVPPSAVDVLSGFDEYLLGYRDKTLMLDPQDADAVVPGGNGVFQWVVARAGRVVATWRRRTTARGVVVTVDPVPSAGADLPLDGIEAALARYATFVGAPVTVGQR